MTHGRPPVQHAWPLNHVLPKVDISDPHTFLTMKRGILQYAWLKPILAAVTIIMKATGSYQEGFIGLTSGYLWVGIVYNISVTLSLYSLAMFWVCMHDDLKPFRPVPKFLCVKLIIFASYWQGFFLSVLQWLGAIPNGVGGYSADNLAAAIQDSLICLEMPIFAVTHWYAFSWHDYADPKISAARLPVIYAVRDAFGIRDLIEDTKETFGGKGYGYRTFDSGDNVMAHEESHSRVARVMAGMRYERGGKAKYWIPKPGEVNSRTPLLTGQESGQPQSSTRSKRGSRLSEYRSNSDVQEATMDEEDERLFTRAREIEFGDWNVSLSHIITSRIWLTSGSIPSSQRTKYHEINGWPQTAGRLRLLLGPATLSMQALSRNQQNIDADMRIGVKGNNEVVQAAQAAQIVALEKEKSPLTIAGIVGVHQVHPVHLRDRLSILSKVTRTTEKRACQMCKMCRTKTMYRKY